MANCGNGVATVRLRWSRYSARLPFLPHHLKAVAKSFDYRWRPLAHHLFREISQSCIGLDTHKDMSPTAMQRWMRAQLLDAQVEQASLSRLMRNPGDLLEFAVRQLRNIKGEDQLNFVPAVPWLAIVHVATLHFRFARCEFCFRWAPKRQRFCAAHSQSGTFPGSKAEKARNYYVGYDTALALGWTRSSPRIKVHCDRHFVAKTIAYHLWGAKPSNERTTFARIRAEIAKAPHVCERLGAVLPEGNASLHALLRERLDPLELWPTAWPEKIALAEKWFSAEAKVTPGRRGRSAKTTSDIARAENLARKGLSITAIARELGCSRTTITKWCSRGRAPRLKELLEERRRELGRAILQTAW